MKAAFIRETGSPDKIIYGDLPDPQPTGAQVLVKVGAVADLQSATSIARELAAMAKQILEASK